MSAFLLRRRKLGNGSCRAIVGKSRTGIQVFRNDRPNIPHADIVFRWGCTSNVDAGVVVNTAEAIHLVNDKISFRKLLQEKELCPQTWTYDQDHGDMHWPVIVRPRKHAQGRKLYVCNNIAEFREAMNRCAGVWYASSIVPKVAEYRVFIVQGRVVAVANKIPANPHAIAWNVAQGGSFENVNWDQWPLKAVKNSIKAFNLSGLDFGGVDVMVDAEGNTYVLEINSACSLTSDYRQECFAKAFDYIVEHGKEHIPLVKAKGGYRKFIHPAICEGALVP